MATVVYAIKLMFYIVIGIWQCLLIILPVRVGMIHIFPVLMKASWSGNILKWTQLTFFLRLGYQLHCGKFNFYYVYLFLFLLLCWLVTFFWCYFLKQSCVYGQVDDDERQLLFLFERGKKKLMEGSRVVFKGNIFLPSCVFISYI